ncbi:39S ribosomal protein L50, mitochondrial [Sergentomyia squamirostris]
MGFVSRYFYPWKLGLCFPTNFGIRTLTCSSVCCTKKKPWRKITTQIGGQRIESVAQSIASKGFLRSCPSYLPPDNVATQIRDIFKTSGVTDLMALDQKFRVLQECGKTFLHHVPNSQLHNLKTIDDVISFYETPINTTLPMNTLKAEDLPENLHVQQDYVRFHPEEDTKFGGVSAFPKSSTLVTGLTCRTKYRGHVAKRSWP